MVREAKPMNVRLVVKRGGQRRVIPVRAARAILGRARGNTVRIPSSEVSRSHCQLLQDSGLVYVEDLNSVNGTLLNGQRVQGPAVVRPGDLLEVGPVTFTVEYELTAEALRLLRGDP